MVAWGLEGGGGIGETRGGAARTQVKLTQSREGARPGGGVVGGEGPAVGGGAGGRGPALGEGAQPWGEVLGGGAQPWGEELGGEGPALGEKD